MTVPRQSERIRDPERTRDLVMDAAAHEFWLHGLEGARIQLIVERAKTTKGGLYHHFTSKQQIADALVREQSERWGALIDAATESARGVVAIGRFFVAVAERAEGDVRARAVLHIARELTRPDEAVGIGHWREYVVRALQQAIADGEVSEAIDTRRAATAVVDALFGVVCVPRGEALELPYSRQRARELWALLEPGLRAKTG